MLFRPRFSSKPRGVPILSGLTLAICLVTSSVSAAPPAAAAVSPAPATSTAAPTGQFQAGAAELTAIMGRAVGLIARAQTTKAAEPTFRTAKARAFSKALAGVSSQVSALAKAVQAPDAKTYEAMSRTGSAIAALQVTFRYDGIEDDDVEDGFEKLAAAYNVFRRNYARDLIAAKTEADSAMSPAQQSARDDLRAKGSSLTKALVAIQPSLKDNPAAAFEVGAILKELTRLDRVPRDRRGLLNQLASAELLLGRRDGLGFYLGEVFRDENKRLDPAEEGFHAYHEAFMHALTAALAGEKPAELFSRPANYVEDLSVPGVSDAELPGLLEGLAKHVAASAETPPKSDPAGARAADAQINAEDPDDDTSLDAAGTEGDPGSSDAASD